MNTFNEYYRDNVVPSLMDQFKYKSPMEVPRLKKITLNMGLGTAVNDKKILETGVEELTQISGQKAVYTYAKKSIANFKLREGMPIGAKVTLRGKRMYEFLDRLLNAALPRIRDFQGIERECFDGRGNCSIGIREHTIFPEIDYNNIDKIRGLQVVIVTTANSDQEGMRLLELAGMPFVKTS